MTTSRCPNPAKIPPPPETDPRGRGGCPSRGRRAPGGQNVNKVNTKVDMRLNLEANADWLRPWVVRRLMVLEKNRVNKDGELVIQSSRFRSERRT